MTSTPPTSSRWLATWSAAVKGLLWLVLALWLLFALTWGTLYGFIVPRLDEFRPALERLASQAVGTPVRVGSLELHDPAGGLRLIPSFELRDVRLLDPAGREALHLPRVLAAVSPRALWNLGFEQLYIDAPTLHVRRDAQGHLHLAGLKLDAADGPDDGAALRWLSRQTEIVVRGGTVHWLDEKLGAPPLALTEVDILIRNGRLRHTAVLDATPPMEFGQRLSLQAHFREPLLSAPFRQQALPVWAAWTGTVFAELPRVDLAQLRRHVWPQVRLSQGRGAVRAWVDVQRGQWVGSTADVAVDAVRMRLLARGPELSLARLHGRINARHSGGMWDISTQGLDLLTPEGQRWQSSQLRLNITEGSAREGRVQAGGEFSADVLELATLSTVTERLPLPEPVLQWVRSLDATGQVQQLRWQWRGEPEAPLSYGGQAEVRDLSLRADDTTRRPGVRGLSGKLQFTQDGGSASVQVAHGQLVFPGIFEEPVIPIERLHTDVTWTVKDGRVDVHAPKLSFANADAEGSAQLHWHTGEEPAQGAPAAPGMGRYPGHLDLQGQIVRADATRIARYLPVGLRYTRNYLRDAVHAGRVVGGQFIVQGPVWHVPFNRDVKGVFRITADVRDGNFAFIPRRLQNPADPPWPELTALSGRLAFDAASMQVEQASGRLATPGGSLQVLRAQAQIADLAHAVVQVQADARGALPDWLLAVQSSPVGGYLGGALANARVIGAPGAAPTVSDVQLRLNIPLADIAQTRVLGAVSLNGADVQFTPQSPVLSRARGQVVFSETGFALMGAQARMLGGDARIEGGSRTPLGPAAALASLGVPQGLTAIAVPASEATLPTLGDGAFLTLRAQGNASAEGMRAATELGWLSTLAQSASGSTSYQAQLTVRRGQPEVSVQSTLQGLALALPAPFGKASETLLPLRFDNSLLPSARISGPVWDQINVEVGRVAQLQWVRDLGDGRGTPRVLRGAISLGQPNAEALAMPERGVAALVKLSDIDIDAWDNLYSDKSAASGLSVSQADSKTIASSASAEPGFQPYLPTRINLSAGRVTAAGRQLTDAKVDGSRQGLWWRANVESRELAGALEVQQPSPQSAGLVKARLRHLTLPPSPEPQAGQTPARDPLWDTAVQAVPALDIVVDRFELRGLALGKLEIDASSRGQDARSREWRMNRLQLSVPEAQLVATGNWVQLGAQTASGSTTATASTAAPASAPGNAAGSSARTAPAQPDKRTALSFTLSLKDSAALLTRLGQPDVFKGGSGSITGQIGWLGSPLLIDKGSLTGQMQVDIANGQFLKADPGIAKLLGVLSLQSLPRRLTLDFRDVFSEGFVFDWIRGDATITQGNARTTNLQMRGVAATVLMEGSADLARETQDLRVLVVPEINAGTASLVASVINPAIGIGTFLAQLALRRPLMEMATQEFHVDGTWTEPRVTRVARTGERAANLNPNPGGTEAATGASPAPRTP
jgi:uncharacterized protein (TIGR02099 family)